MRLLVPFVLCCAMQTIPVCGANFSYAGKITRDDDQRSFTFTLKQAGQVTIRTYSYAGGTNAAGDQVPRGGFDPTISVFDSNGNLLFVNRDGGCALVASDLVTSLCFDSYLQQEFTAGTWQVVLTESENLPQGPTLMDSFCYDGAGNFTADPEGTVDAGFWDFFPNRRTGEYALDILGADSTGTPISSSAGGIVNSGSFQAGSAGPNTVLTLIDQQVQADASTTVTIGGLPAQVLYSAGSQINFVVPPTVQPGENLALDVWSGNVLLLSTTLATADASPSLFTDCACGTGQAAVLNYLSDGTVSYNGVKAPAAAVSRGSYIEVYGTGFGSAAAPGSDGLSWLNNAVTATIGGVPAQVTFSGIAPQSTLGLQQINVLVPDDAPSGPQVSLRLQIGSHVTQSGTTIAIQ